MIIRLYKINVTTGKKTGKKRDYVSKEHFLKYGVETFERYNREYTILDKPTGTKALLCFLNTSNKWEEMDDKMINELWT